MELHMNIAARTGEQDKLAAILQQVVSATRGHCLDKPPPPIGLHECQ